MAVQKVGRRRQLAKESGSVTLSLSQTALRRKAAPRDATLTAWPDEQQLGHGEKCVARVAWCAGLGPSMLLGALARKVI